MPNRSRTASHDICLSIHMRHTFDSHRCPNTSHSLNVWTPARMTRKQLRNMQIRLIWDRSYTNLKVNLDLCLNELKARSVRLSSVVGPKYLRKFWGKSFQRFRICRAHRISVFVAEWFWPLPPWPWQSNHFFREMMPTCVSEVWWRLLLKCYL